MAMGMGAYAEAVPLLSMLAIEGVLQPNGSVRGSDVAARLTYRHLLDLLPSTQATCIIDATGSRAPLTHRSLRHFVANKGFDLSSFGVSYGARCGLLIPNGTELCVCLLSCMNAYCAAPINPFSTAHEILSDCKSYRVRCMIVKHGENNDAAMEVAHTLQIPLLELRPDATTCGIFQIQSHHDFPTTALPASTPMYREREDDVLVLHTSGTSGNKKLVAYTLDMLCVGCGCIVKSWNLSPEDVNMNMMPLFHIGGIVRNLCAPIMSGGACIPCGDFDAVLFWEVLENTGFTWYYAAPTMHGAILHEARRRISGGKSTAKANRVRMIANAAGGLLPILAEQLLQMFGAVVLPSYGMTECMPISSPPFNYKLDKPGSSGVPVGPEVCIVSDEGTPLAINEIGEICIRGPPCFNGYENNSDANSESFLSGGWFKTGDCGKLDDDGFLYITGRSKEIINRGGETISPMEIEQVIVQHPLVHKTMAFSAPHDQLQETIGIVVVPHPSNPRLPDLRSLCEFCEGKLHPSKWPQVLVYMTELPMTLTNKVQRIKMANRLELGEISDSTLWWNRTFTAECPPKGAALTTRIRKHPISLDLDVVNECLMSDPQAVSSSTVIPMQLGQELELVACITPLQDTNQLAKLCERKLHSHQVPRCILALDTLPTRRKTVFTAQKDADTTDAFGLSYRKGSTVTVLHKEASMWFCENDGRKGWLFLSDESTKPQEFQASGTVVDSEAIKNIAIERIAASRHTELPADELEESIERLWSNALGLARVSTTDNFFKIGGDSLKAGLLVSQMRASSGVWLTVAELFSNPTVKGVSKVIRERKASAASKQKKTFRHDAVNSDPTHPPSKSFAFENGEDPREEPDYKLLNSPKSDSLPKHQSPHSQLSPLVLFVQALPLFVLSPWKRATKLFVFLALWVRLLNHGNFRGLTRLNVNPKLSQRIDSLLFAIILATLILGIINPLVGIMLKWLIVGKFKPGRYPLWGSMYLRVWFVDQALVVLGKGVFGMEIPVIGSWLNNTYYRLLGAKIGRNVSIDRKVSIGHFDLLTIGDDVKIDHASIRPAALEAGYFIMLPIVIGDRCSVGAKTTIVPGSHMRSDTHLGPLTSTHEMEDASPKHKHWNRKVYPSPSWDVCLLWGVPILLMVFLLSRLPWFYVLRLMSDTARKHKWNSKTPKTIVDAMSWWTKPRRMGFLIMSRWARDVAAPLVHVACALFIKHTIIGKFRRGRRTSPVDLFKYWLMSQLIREGTFEGITSMVGTHYELISWLYRLFGAKIGKNVYWPGSGISGIVAFDLFEVGNDVTFGSRSFITTATDCELNPVRIEDGAMLADRCMLLSGVTVGKLAVMGSGSLGKPGFHYPMGSTWVGSKNNEAVMLVGEDLTVKDQPTLTPFGRAFYKHQASYFVLPFSFVTFYNLFATHFTVLVNASPLLLTLLFVDLFYDSRGATWGDEINRAALMYFVLLRSGMIANALVVLSMLLFEIGLKYSTVGLRKAGRYPWDKSSYCQRWQIYLSFQQRNYTEGGQAGVLSLIQGSAYIVWFFRALGGKIGKNVCLYPFGADPMMTEPELVTIGDHCSIDNASLIAHINTRGEFALNTLVIGPRSCVRQNSRLVSGCTVGADALVLEHTLIMNGEEVSDGYVCQGWPCQNTVPMEEYEDNTNHAIAKAIVKELESDPRYAVAVEFLKGGSSSTPNFCILAQPHRTLCMVNPLLSSKFPALAYLCQLKESGCAEHWAIFPVAILQCRCLCKCM